MWNQCRGQGRKARDEDKIKKWRERREGDRERKTEKGEVHVKRDTESDMEGVIGADTAMGRASCGSALRYLIQKWI